MLKEKENQELKKNSNFLYPIVIILIICFGIYLRTRLYLFQAEFWLDEVMTSLSFIDKSIKDLFLPLEAEQKAPPLYLCTIYFIVKIFGFNELSFRFIPYISGCLSLTAFYFLLNSFVKDKIGKIFGLILFAISIPLIYNSAEFKPYSSDTLICILLLIFYQYVYSKNKVIIKGEIKQALLYTIITILLVFFSFPASFVIFSMVLTNCLFERKITIQSIFIVLGIIIASSAAFLTDIQGYGFLRDFWWQKESKSIVFMYKTSIKYFMSNQNDKFCYSFTVLLLIGLIILYKDKKQSACVLLICIAVPIIANLLKIYPFEERLILYLLPIFLLLTAKIFDYHIFNIISGKHEIIQKIFLCTALIMVINIKVPYLNFSQDNLIDYRRYDDFKRSLGYRREMKKISLYILQNYNKDIKILSTNEFSHYVKFYNKYYNMKKNICINVLGWDNNGKITDITNKFINENYEKHPMCFISRNDEFYFRNWKRKELKTMLDKKHIPYEIEYKGNVYFVYTL